MSRDGGIRVLRRHTHALAIDRTYELEHRHAPVAEVRGVNRPVPCEACKQRAANGLPEDWRHPACSAHLRSPQR